MAKSTLPDPFASIREATPARIGLARAGQALATAPLLVLQQAEAQARAAVHVALDAERLVQQMARPCLIVRSAAPDRETYLRRPDLGRRLDPQAPAFPRLDLDLALVLADGLCAAAVAQQGPALVEALVERLEEWRLGPVVVALQGRVALGDVVGEALGAHAVVVLIGERPGLSACDSLGAYITWRPAPGRVDSERNCVSNIRPGGLSVEAAADKVAWLLIEARRLGFTGVDLKDRQGSDRIDPSPPPPRLTT